jgi:hypothetical protein
LNPDIAVGSIKNGVGVSLTLKKAVEVIFVTGLDGHLQLGESSGIFNQIHSEVLRTVGQVQIE